MTGKLFSPEAIHHRIERVQERMEDLDALIVTSYENAFYLSGVFLYYNAVIVPRRGEAALIVKHLDLPVAQEGSRLPDIRPYSPYPVDLPGVMVTDYPGAMAQVLREMGLERGRVGMGDFWALLRPFQKLSELLPDASLATAPTILEAVRMVKDPEELQVMRKAAGFVDEAMAAVAAKLAPGIREHELAAEAAYAAWRAAPECSLWQAIVASGPNSLLPHAKVTGRRIDGGDPVIVDLVLCYADYYSGLTRTFIAGDPSPRQRDAYRALTVAQEEILTGARAGLAMKEIARLGRGRLAAEGYEGYIRHSFGHHIGTFPHEEPFLTHSEDRRLDLQMVMCIEPAVYIDGLGGFRVGDQVVVGRDGLERLTHAPQQLAAAGPGPQAAAGA